MSKDVFNRQITVDDILWIQAPKATAELAWLRLRVPSRLGMEIRELSFYLLIPEPIVNYRCLFSGFICLTITMKTMLWFNEISMTHGEPLS